MSRTLLFCLLSLTSCLWPLAASAATITIDYGSPNYTGLNRASGGPIAASQSVVTKLWHRDGVPYVVATEWTIPGISVADIGHMWTLNAANAAGFGVDWSAWQTAVLNLDSFLYSSPAQWRVAFGTPGVPSSKDQEGQAPGYWGPGLRPKITNLDRVEITLEEFFSSPIGSVLRIHPRIIGEGELVAIPEPASWLMLLAGFVHVSCIRRNRR